MGNNLLEGIFKSITSQRCPSELGHNVVERVVTTAWGKKYCLHRDCNNARMDESLGAVALVNTRS